jgi:hypothetical protein
VIVVERLLDGMELAVRRELRSSSINYT